MQLRLVRPVTADVFEAACRFWGEHLGWPVTHGWDEPDRGRIFGYGDTARIEIIEAPSSDPVSGLYVSVQVDDVDAAAARLVAAGVAVIEPPTDRPWGHRNVTLLEPTGMRVVLFAPLPAS